MRATHTLPHTASLLPAVTVAPAAMPPVAAVVVHVAIF